jgi:hypothetical protein
LGAQRVFAYQKGLHLTEEGMRAVTEQAQRAGTSVQETGRDITSVAFSMGDAFHINGSLISRDVGNMINDFEHFGNLSTRQLTQVSVFARRLGVEVEKLTGALDAFADFDKAAENVSQLSQAFGIQLDTLELVQEQDPAANIERLRKSFFAAGRSIENMTRQERALLAQTTGLDEKTASLVFSTQNQGLSYEQIQKQGASAEKQQLSQAEAMEKLANSIERLVKDGQQLEGGFFDIFLKGFMSGIRYSKDWFRLMQNLRQSMRATRFAGIEVGREFVKAFPGVQDVMGGIADLFNPVRFRKMLNAVKTAFKAFFADMTTNPQVALPRLLDRLKKGFTDWFSSGSPAGRRILDGFRAFLKAASHIFAGLLKQAIIGLTEMFDGIKSFLKGGLSGQIGQAQTGVAGFLMDIFEPLITFAKSSEFREIVGHLADSFMSLLKTAWEIIGPHITSFLTNHWPEILAVLFGPAIITGLARGLSTALLAGITGGTHTALSKGTSILSSAVSSLGSATAGGDLAGGAAAAGQVDSGVLSTRSVLNDTRGLKLSVSDIGRLALLGSVIVLGLGAIAQGMIWLAEEIQHSGITPTSIASVGLLMLATGAVMIEIAAVIRILAGVGAAVQAGADKAGAGLLAVGATGLVMAAAAWGLVLAFSVFNVGQIKNAGTILSTIAEFFAIAAGVVLAAIVIGTTIVGTGGTGLLALGAGLLAIAVVVVAMIATVKQIVHEFNDIRIDSGTEQRMNIFVTILTAIGSFAASVAQIAQATAPSFVDLIRGGEPMTARLGSVANLITQLGNTLNGVVTSLVTQAQRLSGTDSGALKNAETLATILSTIGTVVEQLRPPETFTDIGIWDALHGDTVQGRLSQLSTYVQTIASALTGTIIVLSTTFSAISRGGGFTEETERAAKIIGSMLQAIGSLAATLSITSASALSASTPDARSHSHLQSFIKSVLDSIIGTDGNSIFDRMGTVLHSIVDSVKNLTPSDIRALTVASPIISSTFAAISSVADLLASVTKTQSPDATPQEIRQQMSGLTGIVEAITTGLSGSLIGLINNLRGSFSNLTTREATSIKSGATTIGQIFSAITPIVDTIKGFVDSAENGDISQLGNGLSNGLYAIANLIFNPGGHFTIADFTGRMLAGFNTIGGNAQGLSSTVATFSTTIEAIKTGLSSVTAFFSSDVITQLSQLNEAALTPVRLGVDAFNARLTDIDSALKNVKDFNVTTRLTELNHKLGLRSTGRLDFREEPIQFNVNFDIHIDAEELEDVLINRTGARIARLGG